MGESAVGVSMFLGRTNHRPHDLTQQLTGMIIYSCAHFPSQSPFSLSVGSKELKESPGKLFLNSDLAGTHEEMRIVSNAISFFFHTSRQV